MRVRILRSTGHARREGDDAGGAAMKQSRMTFATWTKHAPAKPDRTAYRPVRGDYDMMVREWPTRMAMLKLIESERRRDDRNDVREILRNEWKPYVVEVR
jgi:hypothetical protein